MLKIGFTLIGCWLIVFLPLINGQLPSGVNGGVDCATCTILSGIIERLTIVYNENIISSLKRR